MQNITVTGKISVHPRGFGFVSPEDPAIEDVFIPASRLNGAIDGDVVEIEILTKSAKGFEGGVLSIKKRGRKKIVGTVVNRLKNGDAVIFAPAVGEDREIVLKKEKDKKWNIGDRVAMELLKSKKDQLLCKLIEIYGNIEDATIDTKIAAEEYDLSPTFPAAALAEARAFLPHPPKPSKGRKDFTELETFTIDPVDAKDYDDALSIEKDKKGHYCLGVHIADVSFYVQEGSALDQEAYRRGNSTYLVDRVIPMLPHELSNELCSLKENVDRYTISVMIHYDPTGKIVEHQILRSVIRSQKRFTYEEAKEVLDGKKKSPHLKTLKLLVELCKHLKELRKERGCVELAMPDMRFILGDDGIPEKTVWSEYDITHQMVEEFMIAANEIVASHFMKTGQDAIYRIHDEPDLDQISDFFTFTKLLGFELPKESNSKDIQFIFQQAKESPLLERLAIKYIRSMKLAIYSKHNIGHYGLALLNYTHFTSPIRRYTDLVVHRLLFDKDYHPDLDNIAVHCSETERRSFKAESGLMRLKKIRYLDKLVTLDPERTFAGTVINIKPTGIYFDVQEISFEGFIHVAEIDSDYYHFDEKKCTFVGERSQKSFHLGQKIQVGLKTIDLVYQECTWYLIE